MSGAIVTQSGNIRRVAVTVPAAGGTIASLISSVVGDGEIVLAVKILGKLVNGGDRVALTVASPRLGSAITSTDYTTHGQYVAAGVDYYEPADQDVQSYVKAASDSAATVVVYVA